MVFELEFTHQALIDIAKHKKSSNKVVLNKIQTFLEELMLHPYSGTGKPEALKHDFSGYWSRRINKEHRLVYRVSENTIYINSVYGLYF